MLSARAGLLDNVQELQETFLNLLNQSINVQFKVDEALTFLIDKISDETRPTMPLHCAPRIVMTLLLAAVIVAADAASAGLPVLPLSIGSAWPAPQGTLYLGDIRAVLRVPPAALRGGQTDVTAQVWGFHHATV